MNAIEFIAALAIYSSTRKAQEVAQEAHKGRGSALEARAKIQAIKAAAQAQLEAAHAALQEEMAKPETLAALASKDALATAEKAHAEADTSLRTFLAERPAVVLDSTVIAHGNPILLATALTTDGSALVVPTEWPELFPLKARLLYLDGIVTIDPEWAHQAKITELENELALIELKTARPNEIRAQLATLKGA